MKKQKMDGAVLAVGACCVGIVLLLLVCCGDSYKRLAGNVALMGVVLVLMLFGGFGYSFFQNREKEVGKGANADRNIGKDADRGVGKRADRSIGKDADRGVGKSADRGIGKNAGKSTGKDAGRSAGTKAGEESGTEMCGESGKNTVRKALGRLLVVYLILYVIQLLWVNSVYFYTGWDAGLLRFRVEGIVNGGSLADISADVGYSVYPNNLLLFYVFCLIEKVGMLFSMAEPYNLCIYISCLCVNISCFLGNLVMRRLTKSGFIRGCYFGISTFYILFSPWIMIPYSDTYGMFFVMLGIWGLICLDRKYLKEMVVAFASIIGYYIKPTCIFPLFVFYMVYGTRYLVQLKRKWKELCVLLLGTAVFWCVGLLIPLWIQHTYSFRLFPEMRIPYTHYLMMGMNASSKGAYNHDDFLYSYDFPDVDTRKQANMEEFRYRLRELQEGNALGSFLKDKALVNFNDGTFSWAGEGGFFTGYVEHDNILAKLFQRTVLPAGIWESDAKYYALFRTIMQTIWLFLLTGILFVGIDGKHAREKVCLMIAICGLIAFVMLFEARARYLYLYSPVFLILSLSGYESVWGKILRRFSGKVSGDKSTSFPESCTH